MLNVKWVQLIKLMTQSTNAVTYRKLASELGCNEKTVKRLLEDNMQYCEEYGFELIIYTDKVQLEIQDEKLFQKFTLLSSDESNFRINYILCRLIECNDYIKIENLSNELFVSRMTVDRLMKSVKAIAQFYDLTIVSRPKYGICIQGSEQNKRLCYAHYISYDIKENDEILLAQIQQLLLTIIHDSSLKLNDINFYNLVFHCMIAIRRLKRGHVLEDELNYQPAKDEQEEFSVASRIVKQLEQEFGIVIPSNEICYIAMHLLGKRIIDNRALLHESVIQITSLILERIKEEKHIDFTDDSEFLTALALHLQPLLSRVQFGIQQKNPMLEQIKKEMNVGYEMALYASKILYQEKGLKMIEDEVSYLAMHFALAIEKKKTKPAHKKIAVVCASGRGTSKLFQFKLVNRYHMREEDLELLSVYELYQMDLSKYAFVLSTIPIHRKLSIPVVVVDAMLGRESLEKLDKVIIEEDNPQNIHDFLKKRCYVYLNRSMNSKQEVLDFMCKKFQEKLGLDERFVQSVLEREQLSTTEVGNEVALPHPYISVTEDVYMMVVTLNKAVKWKYHSVKTIIMLLWPKSMDTEFMWLNDRVIEICLNNDKLNQLTKFTKDTEVYQWFLKE